MSKKDKQKKWSWYKITNIIVLIILFILCCVFTGLFVINQEKYTVAFLILMLLLGIWVTGYFMGHFIFINRESIKTGAKKIVDDYRKKDKNEGEETKEEKIKRLEEEIKQLKEKNDNK